MIYQNLWLHNINEVEEADGKHILHRFPRQVRENLESNGKTSTDYAAVEIRFIIRGKVTIGLSTISPENESQVIIFYGDNQYESRRVTYQGIRLDLDLIYSKDSRDKIPIQGYRFSPDLVRIQLFGHISLDEVSGAPDFGDYTQSSLASFPAKKYLAYGTSITQSKKALSPDLNFPGILGALTGYDVYNYGMSGRCYLEDAIIDFLSSEPYDFITLCLSVNMIARGDSAEKFRERTDKLLAALSRKNPNAPIFLISVMANWRDLGMAKDESKGDHADCEAYRDVLRALGQKYPRCSFIDGRKVVSYANLTTDFTHPGDYGMIEIAYNLYEAFKKL
jgi:lysophospholipase L1-like esterase